MKDNEKHIIDVDQILRQVSVNDYEPSPGFVNDLMSRIENLDEVKKPNRFLRIGFQLAAACAILVFITNAFIILSSLGFNNSETSDWASVYETKSTANWFDYDNDDTFLANNQTNK
ncbi:hypothetical protein J1N10_16730 [Carboxylicivirga sp. A043]|uniref:hypothetical protein n=1 Tax=Carboxylicivirga litoralis TaxID=2816963 RepID=UPI0021CB54B6|nr:hypothetical protein [Carboxylicivirga sp. A043]MCU4157624.1 hypothetical protein [Carboxylicivirga sp. A043]